MVSPWLLVLAPFAVEAAVTANSVSDPAGEVRASADTLSQRQQQARVEAREVVRIPPRSAQSSARRLRFGAAYRERKTDKCLPLTGIAGVGVEGDERLLLYMRDRRVIGVTLENACRARDFYSGFYMERSGDGRLCAGRDLLLARSGATCAVSRLRELVDPDD